MEPAQITRAADGMIAMLENGKDVQQLHVELLDSLAAVTSRMEPAQISASRIPCFQSWNKGCRIGKRLRLWLRP